ncbi:hypothetical protein [Helicobacter suis]|uniref:hypothetical protein n=1 Tax=Helicobacter suis TaxID=104628 RepID=UPI0019674584|nr:hypothetical protein [Helicobacter suis]
MGNISSINFQPTTNKNQLSHNDRSTPPHYLLPPEKRIGIECNRSALVAETLKNTIIENAIAKYTKSTKQKFKAKSFLWSAVVNIKETTTMQDLEKLAQHFLVKYGFQCYQIGIHRDEGHVNNQGETIINHHAHLEFVTLDKNTGRSLFRDKVRTSKSLSIIQSEVAEILNMERGKPKNDVVNNEGVVIQKGTNLKHLSHFAYRAIKAKQNQEKEIITKELDTAKNLFKI